MKQATERDMMYTAQIKHNESFMGNCDLISAPLVLNFQKS